MKYVGGISWGSSRQRVPPASPKRAVYLPLFSAYLQTRRERVCCRKFPKFPTSWPLKHFLLCNSGRATFPPSPKNCNIFQVPQMPILPFAYFQSYCWNAKFSFLWLLSFPVALFWGSKGVAKLKLLLLDELVLGPRESWVLGLVGELQNQNHYCLIIWYWSWGGAGFSV